MAAQLGVVIPVYNNWWLTARALRELDRLRSSSAVAFETIVVDNASSDETSEGMRAFPWVRYERQESNLNFGGACNLGARLSEAPLVLFLNSDAYPLGDAFAPLVRAFDREEVAIASGALFFEDGATQAAGFVVLPNAHWHYSYRNMPASLPGVTHSRDAIGVSGAAMTVRRDWFLEGGGFDGHFVNGFEDVDLCMRAREERRAIAYVADSRFAHYEGASAGRYDREAENERRFYARWSRSFAAIPRTAHGDVGAIAVESSPAAPVALEDLLEALAGFGHPVVRGAIGPLQRLDRRYRRAASLAWFATSPAGPGVAVEPAAGELATLRTTGAVELRLPWLPCASAKRVAELAVSRSERADCRAIGVAGHERAAPHVRDALVRALDALTARGEPVTRIDLNADASAAERAEVACVVHLGLTDATAFGNVLLAQADLPSVAVEGAGTRAIFAGDVASFAQPEELAAAIAPLLGDPALRARMGALAGADARRRFSPRRTAVRVVDLLCAARFGLERPARAHTNSPL